MPSHPSSYRVSGQDPFLYEVIDTALAESPWLSLADQTIRLDWTRFLLQSPPTAAADLAHETRIRSHLEAMGSSLPIRLYTPGRLRESLTAGAPSMSGLALKQAIAPLPTPILTWLESFRDLTERCLFEWDDALRTEAPTTRSQFLRHFIVPGLQEELRAARAIHSATTWTVVYPLALRLALGAALPSDLVDLGFSLQTRSTVLQPTLGAFAAQSAALQAVWRYLDAAQQRRSGGDSPQSTLGGAFSHHVFAHLRRENAIVARMAYQRSKYALDEHGQPLREEGFAHMRTLHVLLDAQGAVVKKLAFPWDSHAARILHTMCQSLKNFCTYFYSFTSDPLAHSRRMEHHVTQLQARIPRLLPEGDDRRGRFEIEPTSHAEAPVPDPAFLGALDRRLEQLVERTPLLLLLGTGILSTYTTEAPPGWGLALGPQAMATALAAQGWQGRLFHYLRAPESPASPPTAETS